MTRDELLDIAAGKTKLTRTLAVSLANALLDVLVVTSKMQPPGEKMVCPNCHTEGGHSFELGYRTAKIVIAERVKGWVLPS